MFSAPCVVTLQVLLSPDSWLVTLGVPVSSAPCLLTLEALCLLLPV